MILLELRMPHKNGFELAAEMNHVLERTKIPIIAMTRFFNHEFKFLLLKKVFREDLILNP